MVTMTKEKLINHMKWQMPTHVVRLKCCYIHIVRFLECDGSSNISFIIILKIYYVFKQKFINPKTEEFVSFEKKINL